MSSPALVLAIGLFLAPFARAFETTVAVGPDCNTGVLLNAIQSAQNRLQLNVYQLEKPSLVAALVARIQSGVQAQIFVEGQPLGGISKDGHRALEQIRDAIAAQTNGGSWLRIQYKKDPANPRRYPFNHAKYMVMDGVRAWVSSDNWSQNGHADPGRKGNRGWDLVLEQPAVAGELNRIFQEDSDTSQSDVLEIGPKDPIPSKPILSTDGAPQERGQDEIRLTPAFSPQKVEARSAEVITSPGAAPALVKLIQSAKSRVFLEHMSMPSVWQVGGRKDPNPVVEELIHAAERGVEVKVLLNDDDAFAMGQGVDAAGGNLQTVKHLNSIAKKKKLPLEARTVDVGALGITYIHNKGIIVDDHLSLVSSINGSRNSVVFNRELAIQLDSEQANAYFSFVFGVDWNASATRRRSAAPTQLGYLR